MTVPAAHPVEARAALREAIACCLARQDGWSDPYALWTDNLGAIARGHQGDPVWLEYTEEADALLAGPLAEHDARLAAVQAERDEARNDRRVLTGALTRLTCGGSEFFVRRGAGVEAEYVADATACVSYVRKVKQSQHETIIRFARQAREAEAKADRLTAENATLTARVAALGVENRLLTKRVDGLNSALAIADALYKDACNGPIG